MLEFIYDEVDDWPIKGVQMVRRHAHSAYASGTDLGLGGQARWMKSPSISPMTVVSHHRQFDKLVHL